MRIFYWLFYWLSGFVPRSNKIWVFGGWFGEQFAGNSKWFFLYCHQISNDKQYVWITKNKVILKELRTKGIKAYLKNSIGGIWYSLRANIFIFDCYYTHDINFWTSKGSIKVNLWHGIALKKIERDIDVQTQERYQHYHVKKSVFSRILSALKSSYVGSDVKYDLMISTSNEVTKIFSSAFGLMSDAIPTTGFPRNDVLLEIDGESEIIRTENLSEVIALIKDKKRIFLYMPTFRDTAIDNILPFDFDKLNQLLESLNSVLLLKLHNSDTRFVDLPNQSLNIISLSNKLDIYPILSYTDALITDYSSIYFDYLILDKPIIFYPYDLENYLKFDRGMYFEYDAVTPGPKAYNLDEILNLIKLYINNYDVEDNKWKTMRHSLTEKFHYYKDSSSSKRVYEAIEKKVSNK